MEIKTSMTTCPNGHHYDAAKHSGCPFCAGASFGPTEPIGGGGFGSFGATEPVGGNPGFSPTEPPAGATPSFGSTMPPDGTPNAFSVATTMAGSVTQPGRPGQIDPVVGWLVCAEGPARGSDFRIHAGYNYIGRDSGDIRIPGDTQISRQNHAMVAFDSGENLFFVGPATGRNLIKVNGKPVFSAVEVHNYDVISIGSTKLVFIGLCGPQFTWVQEDQNHA